MPYRVLFFLSLWPAAALHAQQELTQLQQHPEFNNYLAFILARLGAAESPEVRQRAGLMLKNNCANSWATMHPLVQAFVRTAALDAAADAHPYIRQTVGSLIATIGAHGHGAGLLAWPQALPHLVHMLALPQADAVDGALNALSKLCEECADVVCG
jgi:transportin-1